MSEWGMKAADLPEPTTGLEAVFLTVLRAWLTKRKGNSDPKSTWDYSPFFGNCGWDMMQILVGVVSNNPWLVKASTKLYDPVFWNVREIYELLKSYIRLTKSAEIKLLKHYAEEAAKLAAKEGPQPA
jgi:hypothetical protein